MRGKAYWTARRAVALAQNGKIILISCMPERIASLAAQVRELGMECEETAGGVLVNPKGKRFPSVQPT